MSIFVSTTYFGDGSDIQKAINQLEKSGIFNVELGSNHSPCQISSLDLHKNSSYIAHNYFPSKDPSFVLNIASENSMIRFKSITYMKNTVKICQKLKIKFYTIHPGFLGDVFTSVNPTKLRNFDFKFKNDVKSNNRQAIIKRTTKIITNLASFANEHEVQLLVENEGSQTSKEFVIFDLLAELIALKREIGKNLRFNFNLAHATLAGINLNDPKVLSYFYNNSDFFEVSEIDGIYDSHLPVYVRGGQISRLLSKNKKYFHKKNIILEFRNIGIKKVSKSYEDVNKILNTGSPVI